MKSLFYLFAISLTLVVVVSPVQAEPSDKEIIEYAEKLDKDITDKFEGGDKVDLDVGETHDGKTEIKLDYSGSEGMHIKGDKPK